MVGRKGPLRWRQQHFTKEMSCTGQQSGSLPPWCSWLSRRGCGGRGDALALRGRLAEIWRNKQETLPRVEVSDIFAGRPEKTVVEPDTVLAGLTDRIGWHHRNVKSVGPELCAKVQGVADFPRPDPLPRE